jgi:hypothetical protein
MKLTAVAAMALVLGLATGAQTSAYTFRQRIPQRIPGMTGQRKWTGTWAHLLARSRCVTTASSSRWQPRGLLVPLSYV